MARQTQRALACALALLVGALIGPPAGGVASARASSDGPPNIVVIYIDDAAPHDGRLWSDPNLTPTLAERFVEQGIHFPNAIVENPLCCPARGNLLTGLHTHNNGLNSNHARKLKPSEHIGWALRRTGYDTMYIGKYLNRVSSLSSTEWAAHAAGWTHFDVTKGSNGQFYDYTLYTKQGDITNLGGVHATRMIAQRFVERSRQVPADKPLFALLSIYNLHAPNTPMPEFATDARCSSMPPWKPPNYNEADMTDKPAFQQSRPLLPYPNGWPMVNYCREMLGVDWAARTVVDELQAQGRLDNTLLIFTADNGMGWGAHRVGQNKRLAQTTPVPLYMSWPARWGDSARAVDEHVSNIDLAPTFCDIAGCQLGPFPTGQAGPDGVSFLGVVDGTVPDLGRQALLEVSDDPALTRHWHALRTTAQHPAGLWHYVEWSTGERELYDLQADPWELQNLANKALTASLRTALSTQLAQLRREGAVGAPPSGAAPSVPQGLTATPESNFVIRLAWEASVGAPEPLKYRVFRNGTAIGTLQTGTTYVDQRSKENTFTYQVRAVDAAGRKGALSAPITVTSKKSVDSPPPAVGPSVPQGLTATASSNFVINLSWQASTSDQAGTIRYRVFRNGTAIGTLQTSLTFVDQRKKANTFTYQVRAVDAAGRKSALSPPVTVSSRR